MFSWEKEKVKEIVKYSVENSKILKLCHSNSMFASARTRHFQKKNSLVKNDVIVAYANLVLHEFRDLGLPKMKAPVM